VTQRLEEYIRILAGLQNRKHLVPARLNDGFGWRGHSFFI
jgi:hypothetical protein